MLRVNWGRYCEPCAFEKTAWGIWYIDCGIIMDELSRDPSRNYVNPIQNNTKNETRVSLDINYLLKSDGTHKSSALIANHKPIIQSLTDVSSFSGRESAPYKTWPSSNPQLWVYAPDSSPEAPLSQCGHIYQSPLFGWSPLSSLKDC